VYAWTQHWTEHHVVSGNPVNNMFPISAFLTFSVAGGGDTDDDDLLLIPHDDLGVMTETGFSREPDHNIVSMSVVN
jgi:hypothetical protein